MTRMAERTLIPLYQWNEATPKRQAKIHGYYAVVSTLCISNFMRNEVQRGMRYKRLIWLSPL
jgi:hypothetical protein